MIALHAIWSSESKLCIWGEDSSLAAKLEAQTLQAQTKQTQTKRRAKSPQLRSHPFACEPDWLREAIDQISSTLDNFTETDLAILLPTLKDTPQASPHLLRDSTEELEQNKQSEL